MYENFDKKTQAPCMKYGEQKKKDFLSTPQRNSQRTYPSKGAAQQEYPNGNEKHILLQKGSGLMGKVNCSGKKGFATEKAANWKVG